MNFGRLWFLLIAILFLLSNTSFAQESGFSDEEIEQIIPLKYQAQGAVELDQLGIITPMQRDAAIEHYTRAATNITGVTVGRAELLSIEQTAGKKE